MDLTPNTLGGESTTISKHPHLSGPRLGKGGGGHADHGDLRGMHPMAREGGDEAGRTNARPLDPSGQGGRPQRLRQAAESFEPSR